MSLSAFLHKLNNSLWLLGLPFWLGAIVRFATSLFPDETLCVSNLFNLAIASFCFLTWLYLDPAKGLNGERLETLRDQHLISQEYLLPFPYLCQIYHLLNLKHLENVHHCSLNNLKVVSVSQFKPTNSGGIIKFKTTLDSPFNLLRIWRQHFVEVELILHNPYTVELKIPVYNQKQFAIIFNVLPLGQDEHKLFIDIYSTLAWPKPLLQILLHLAASITLFEDLPYLHKLAKRNLHRLVSSNRISNHETMQLFKRFASLYGSQKQQAQLTGVPEG